jgi:hypothetical protein
VTVFKPFGKKLPKKLPGLTWGKDVDVICPCCSFAECPHRAPAIGSWHI